MSCAALIGAAICAAFSGEPRLMARDASMAQEYVEVDPRSFRRHRHRYRHSQRRRAPRVVVVYRDRAPKNESRPGPCLSEDAALVERAVQTERIVVPRIEPAKIVREAFEELSVSALMALGRARTKW